MSTECLEGCVEDKKRVEESCISGCMNQVFVQRKSFPIYDILDSSKQTILRITNSPNRGYRKKCSGCINDEGNFMCGTDYVPVRLRTFDVKKNLIPSENIGKFPDPEDVVSPWPTPPLYHRVSRVFSKIYAAVF